MNPFGTYTADAAPIPDREAEGRSVNGEDMFFPGVAGSAGVLVTERTALQLSSMFAVMNVLSSDVAVLPLRVYKRRPDGGRDLQADDQRDDMLSVSPDGETTAISWRQSWMCHALLYGNGYAEIQRNGRGAPVALHLLSPEQTEARRDGSTGKLGYRIAGGRTLPSANVLHLAGIGFDGLNGFNVVRLLRQAIGVGLAEEGFTADFYANDAFPGGIIETPQRLDLESRRNLMESWQSRHGSAGNKHRVGVLEQGVKFSPLTVDPDKAQLIESRRYQVIDLARPWRVPPHKIGDFSEAHLKNVEASNIDYLMTALMPWLVVIEQQCHLKLFTPAERRAGYYVEHQVNALLRGDVASRFKAYSQALIDGWLSRNEVRAMENKAPIPEAKGGDKYIVQSNQTTLEQIGEVTAPGGPGGLGGGVPAAPGSAKTTGPTEETPTGDANNAA